MVEPIELQTERLVLRRFRSSDVEDVLVYRDDAEFSRYLPHIPQPFTRRDAEEFVTRNMAEPWNEFPTFAVALQGTVVGTVNLDVSQADGIAMLGFAISRAHWGKGIGSEAVSAAVAWGFDAFGLAKIWATTDARSVRSQRLMERFGMQLEGRLRSHERSRWPRRQTLLWPLACRVGAAPSQARRQ